MELLKYIFRFFYRIRWWMVIPPLVTGILVWFFTRNMEKTYDVKTTIYTGIITGYNVDSSDSRNARVHMSNLMNIITTERTLKIVSLKLLTRCLIYGDAERNTSYITAEHFQQLNASVPREVRALIDKQNEERTYQNLVAYERPSATNFIYSILNYTHPYFSVAQLSEKLKVAQLGNSDLIEIGYTANDPGITYNTLDILNEEFVKQYRDLRYGETNNVIKFFREELARLGKQLTEAEDSLIDYNIAHRIINYAEQTKQVTIMDATYQMMDNDLLINTSTSRALIDFYEYKLGDLAKLIRSNSQFLANMSEITQINSDITGMQVLPTAGEDDELKRQKERLSHAESQLSDIVRQISAESASTHNLSIESLVTPWLEQVVLREKTLAQIEARDIMRAKLDEDFLYFSPIGAILNRKERNISFVESNYMSIMGALNQAILRQKNLEMTAATLKVMNPPLFPLNSSANNARMIILASILGVLLAVIGYFLLIEILDHTLRDKIRSERLIGAKVLGVFPKESALRYRRYNKAIEQLAIRQLSTALLPHLNGKKRRIINLLSTEEQDGKSLLGKVLENYWSSIGLEVRRIVHEEDFLSEDSHYVAATTLEDLCPDSNEEEIVIIEHPTLKNNPILPQLLNEAAINLLVARANRTWKTTDQSTYNDLVKATNSETPLQLCLMQGDRYAIEDFVGQLPPYGTLKNLVYRLSQLGLTAHEYRK
ncbi:MAG: GumC family protein [Phocaeicola sp.]